MSNGITPEINQLLALRHSAKELQLFNPVRINSLSAGINLSHARGRGMDFDEVRRYQAGDDIRLIHWQLSARLGKTYTKVYHEERERALYLIIDQSISMRFATKVAFKSVIAANLAAIFGWAALGAHQQVGGIVFNEANSSYVKPKRSRQSLLDMFNLLSSEKLTRQQGGLINSLQFILQQVQSGSSVIVLSDFSQISPEVERYLRLIAQKSELTNILIYDPIEANLPISGSFNFTNQAQQQLEISANSRSCERYALPFAQAQHHLRQFSRQNGMHFLTLATNDDLVTMLKRGIHTHGK